VAGGSGMACHGIHLNVRHIGILHVVSILTISPQSTCHSTTTTNNNQCAALIDAAASIRQRLLGSNLHHSAKFYPNRTTSAEKNDIMSIFKMADLSHLGFYGSNNGLFENPM